MATPTALFDPGLVVSQALVLNGQLASADLNAAVDDVEVERTITGASTLTITLEDPTRKLMRSAVFASAVTCTIAGLSFTLTEISKSGNTLTLTFEDSIVAKLRNTSPPGSQAGTTAVAFASSLGSMTRSQFAQRIWATVWGAKSVKFRLVNGTTGSAAGSVTSTLLDPSGRVPPLYTWGNAAALQEVLTWGTTSDPTEDAWTCLVRLANEVQWRCFSDGTAGWFGPDEWLLERSLAATLQEHVQGVGDIDFDWDIGKTEATATTTCVCGIVAFPPGAPVELSQMGVAEGVWLVEDMSRSLYLLDATVDFVQAQPALSEPLQTGTPSLVTNTAGTPIGGTSAEGSATAMEAVQFALDQVGKPYIWGGVGPTGYDCSGLVMAAYASVGVTIPRTSEEQWAELPHVALDALLPGDLVFYQGSDGTPTDPGHVVMYIGNGQVVEAAHTGTNIMVTNLYGGAIGAARPAP